MPILNTNTAAKEVVILQRDDTNTYYGEVHTSGSLVIPYLDSNGYLTFDKSDAFYSVFPPTSGSWASQSLSTSYFITSVPLPVDQRLVQPDLTARDNIPLGSRYVGMTVYVISQQQDYRLIGGTSNLFWVPVPISSSFATNASFAITASYALNASGSGGGGTSITLSGSNNYVPFWWNNTLATRSLIYSTNDNVGINTPNPSAIDALTVTALSGSNILWTPTLLSIPARLWYRADSIPLLSASFVDLWSDSSPYQNNATASSPTAKPELIYNQLNGYPSVRFNGFNNQMRCLTPSSISCSVLTAFVVANVAAYAGSSTPSSVGTIIGNSHPGDDRDFVIGEYFDGGTSQFIWTLYTEDSSSAYSTVTPVFPFNALTGYWYINTVIVTGSASSTTIYLSGSASGSGTSNQSINLDLHDLYIGYESASNKPFNGDIAEIIIVTQSLSVSDQQKVEGYLAWKYGMQGNLPAAHPYKTSMPVLGGGGNIQSWKDFNNNLVGFFSSSGVLYATTSYTLTASWAPPIPSNFAISASWASESFWATSASFASQSIWNTSSSFASRSMFSTSASWSSASISSSFATNAFTSSFAITSSYSTNLNPNAVSASWASASISASYAVTASYATNPNPNAVSASWASASISASYAITASYAINANPTIVSASWASQSLWATSASFASRSLFSVSSSFASQSISASWAPPVASDYAISASWSSQSFWATSASFASRSLFSVSSSWASQSVWSVSSSFASASISSSFSTSASWAPPIASDFAISASWASESFWATSASFASRSISSSFAVSASWAPTFGIVGTNNYFPKWQNNTLTTSSLVYDTGVSVGVNATSSQIDSELTIIAFSPSHSILWDPSYMSVPARIWLRADDVSGGNGSSVSYWPDTSSFGNYFTQSTSAEQPALATAALNGHSVVHFNGVTASMLSVSGSASISQSSLCVFAVVKPNTFPTSPSSNNSATVIGNAHAGQSRDFHIGVRTFSGVTEWAMYSEDTVTNYDIDALVTISQSWYIVNGNVNSNNSILTVYINSAATSSGFVNGSSNLDLRDLYIGYEPSFDYPLNGDIAEIIVTTAVISQTEQRKVEGYLAWKYGLQSNLPSNHAYATVAPYALDARSIQSWKDINTNTVAYVSSSGLYVGTASWANNAVSSSWAPPIASDYAVSASWSSASFSSSYAITSSFALTSSYPWGTTGSNIFYNNGYVGIMDVNPQNRLSVIEPVANAANYNVAQFVGTRNDGNQVNLIVQNTDPSSTLAFAGIQLKLGTTEGGELFASRAAVPSFGIVNGITFSPTSNTQDIGFRAGAAELSGSAAGPTVQIKSTGLIGMGVPTPANARLHLGGTDVTCYNATIRLTNGSAGGADIFLAATDNAWGTSSAGKLLIGPSDPSSGSLTFLQLDTNSNNVGIGLTGSLAPQGKLHVQGNITASSVTASLYGTASWAENTTNTISSSYASQSDNTTSASWASSSVFSIFTTSASFASQSISSSYSLSGSWAATCSVFIYSNITQSLTFVTSASWSSESFWSTSASFSSQSISSSFSTTASFALNANNSSNTNNSSSYSTIFTSSTNWITASFLTSEQYVTISTGSLYNFTCSDAPTSTKVLATTVFINNISTTLTSSLSFPSNWIFMGSVPSSLTSSKSAILSLKAYGSGSIVAGFSVQY